MNENLDPSDENFTPEEFEVEKKLRPLSFEDFSGQDQVLENLKIFVQAANLRSEALDHTLFHGPPGLGKTTLAHILANELQVGIKVTSGPVLDKPGDLAGLLTNLDERDVLFIDEIQAAPEILAKLRWFAEDYPELPVVTAGSLLEFTLAEHSFSMPVGRIQYMHIEPLSFEEFLQAIDQTKLYAWLHTFEWGKPVPTAIHQQLMQHFKEYIIVGGLPAAVASWIEERSLSDVNRIHYDLLSTYRDDFAKYAGRVSLSLLEDVLNAIPKMLGNKFVYSRINKDEQVIGIHISA